MNAFRIAWIAVRELLYERVFYVLLSFTLLSLGMSLVLGQMTFAEQYKLTLDFMLAGSQISMILFSVFVGISLFQKELMTGSVSMVLAKPISRSSFLLGKFLGQSIVQGAVIVGMALLTILMSLGHEKLSVRAICETFFLIYMEVTVLTAITYVFAVNAGAITTAVAAGCMFVVGHLRESVGQNMNDRSLLYGFWNVAKNIFPNLEIFNVKSLASYGMSLEGPVLGWAVTYALICVLFYLVVACLTFQQRDILT